MMMMTFSPVSFWHVQQQQHEFYAVHESRSGRQLLQSDDVDEAGKLVCNTGIMLLYAENITFEMADSTGWQPTELLSHSNCQAVDCPNNSTKYVILVCGHFVNCEAVFFF